MDRYVIGVAGGTGAGKTTFADALARCILPGSAVVIHEDRYYRDHGHLPLAARESLNYDHPDSIDLELLASHVRKLVAGMAVDQPLYDFFVHARRSQTVAICPARLIIVEGLFTLFNRLLRDIVDLKIFLDLEEDARLSRRLERDISERGRTRESVLKQWNTTVQPMHDLFIQPSISNADMILSGGDRVDDNVARVRDLLLSNSIL